MSADDYKNIIRADRTPAGEQVQRFNAPFKKWVAAVIFGYKFEKEALLRKKDYQLQRVSETRQSYNALQYPLIFWHGQDGYHFAIHQIDHRTEMQMAKKSISGEVLCSLFDGLNLSRQPYPVMPKLLRQFVENMQAKMES